MILLDNERRDVDCPVRQGMTVVQVAMGVCETTADYPAWAKIVDPNGSEVSRRRVFTCTRLPTSLEFVSRRLSFLPKYLIGAIDGVHSEFQVRKSFPEITFDDAIGNDTEIIWAVFDGEVENPFERRADIINVQVHTNDVARIPRDGAPDRFYVWMDHHDFEEEDAIGKISRAVHPSAFFPLQHTGVE